MTTILFIVLVLISIIIFANIWTFMRSVGNLVTRDGVGNRFDWLMGIFFTAAWVIIWYLTR